MGNTSTKADEQRDSKSTPNNITHIENERVWLLLNNYPRFSKTQSITIPNMINKDDFIITTYCKWGDESNGKILNYDVMNNEWKELMNHSESGRKQIRYHTTSYHSKRKRLYINGESNIDNTNMIVFDLYQRKITQIIQLDKITQFETFKGFNNNLCSVFVDDKLHIIGSRSKVHYVYDINTNKMTKLNEIPKDGDSLSCAGLVYVKSKDILLLFGGYDHSTDNATDIVYRYSINNNEWRVSDTVRIPKPISEFGCCKDMNEKYIFVLGGHWLDEEWTSVYSNDIFIYDIQTKLFRMSKVKCPIKGDFHAIIAKGIVDTNILVSGYIRQLFTSWLNSTIVHISTNRKCIPNELMHFIQQLVSDEYVYLLLKDSATKENNNCWKISVDMILRS